MSNWRTLNDGRKVMVQGAGPSESVSEISKSFKNPESLVRMRGKPIREQGKMFSTLCFWCRAPVYFVENSNNGGCFLADRTPSDGGWKVHSCWLVNKGTDKSAVIRHYRQKIKEKKQLKNTQKNTNRTKKKKQIFDYELIHKIRKLRLYSSHKKFPKFFVANFELIEVNTQILINKKSYQVAQFRDRGYLIRALLQSESFPNGLLGQRSCMISLKVKKMGKEKLPIISEIFAQDKVFIVLPKKIKSFEVRELQ